MDNPLCICIRAKTQNHHCRWLLSLFFKRFIHWKFIAVETAVPGLDGLSLNGTFYYLSAEQCSAEKLLRHAISVLFLLKWFYEMSYKCTSQIKMNTTLFLGFQAKWQKLGRNEVMRILMLLCVSLKKIFTRTSNTRVLFKSRFNANAHFLVEYLIFFWSDNSYQWPDLLGNMLC